jgi:type VI protein secretion system component VasK
MKKLAFEHEHMDEIKEEMSKLAADEDWVCDAILSNSKEQFIKAGQACVQEDACEFGLMLYAATYADLWKAAVDRVEENYTLQEDFEKEEHPSLTCAERNPDMLR